MDLSSILKINNVDFEIESSIGEGAQGDIYSAVNHESGISMAIKISDFTQAGKWRNFIIETDAIRTLQPWRFRYLCNILDFYEDDTFGIIAMEEYDCDLFDFAVEQNRGIGEDFGRSIFQKICIGLKSMHSSGIAHLDIKPENIMYNLNTDTPYIGDFGCCYNFVQNRKCVSRRGTTFFHPPEYANQKSFNPRKSDVFSLGVTLHILLTGLFPYDVSDEIDKRKYFIDESLSPECRHLIKRMLKKNPKKRISLKDVMNHPWLLNIKQESKLRKATNSLTKSANGMLNWSLQRIQK